MPFHGGAVSLGRAEPSGGRLTVASGVLESSGRSLGPGDAATVQSALGSKMQSAVFMASTS